jgi:hypothetical protein
MVFLYILWCNFRELAREGLQSKPRVLSLTFTASGGSLAEFASQTSPEG